METYTFWREREARFSKLAEAPGAVDLHATHVVVDVQAVLDDASERTRQVIDNPSVTPESVYHHARTTARAGRILLDGEQADRWVVSGGPSNDGARAALQVAFKIEARIAAAGAGAADAGVSEQASLEAWLDLLARGKSAQWQQFPVLEHLAQASGALCNQLAAEAYISATRPTRAAAPTRSARFPRRAAWLQKRLDSGLSAYRIYADDGPDKKTTERILRGEPVRSVTLDKLSKALGVSRRDIPDD